MPISANAMTVTYTIHAPVKEVFNAWITPKLLQRWGPEKAIVDPRPGGSFRFESRAEDNPKELHLVTGEYKQFVPEKLLVLSWIYEGPMEPGKKVETEVTVNFNPIENRVVELIVREEGPSLADDEALETARLSWMDALKMLEILCSAK